MQAESRDTDASPFEDCRESLWEPYLRFYGVRWTRQLTELLSFVFLYGDQPRSTASPPAYDDAPARLAAVPELLEENDYSALSESSAVSK